MRDPIRCTLSPHLRLPTVTQRQWVKNVSRNEQGLLAEVKQCPAVSNSISLSLSLSLYLSLYLSLSIYLSLFLSLSSSCIRSRFGFLFPFSVTVLTFSASCLFSLTPRLRNSIKSTETMISTRVARKSSSSKNREPLVMERSIKEPGLTDFDTFYRHNDGVTRIFFHSQAMQYLADNTVTI